MVAMSWLTQLKREIGLLLRQPTHELNRAERWARYTYDLCRYSYRTLKQHRASQMAAALTYRTIFSLIPLLVVALLIIRMFGGFDYFGQEVQDKLSDYFGLSSLTENGDAAAAQQPPDPDAAADPQQVPQSIQKVIDDVDKIISNVNFRSIGVVGLLILFWAAIALLVTVEQCFNNVYGAPSGRAWHMRVITYWAVITLGPILLLVSLYAAGRIGAWTEHLLVVGGFFQFLSRFAALAASWLLLFALYLLMPNAHVRRRPAMIGSFIAAVLWEIGKWGFSLYVSKAVPYSALYGSLFLIPLFLFWVYLNWLIVLFGLEITYTLQTLPDFRRRQRQALQEQRTSGDPMWLIPVITRIGQAFNAGAVIGSQTLSEELDLPLPVVVQLANKLETEGLIHRVEDTGGAHETGYTLAAPPQQIHVTRLLDIAKAMSRSDDLEQASPGWACLDTLAAAQRITAADTTLATVLADE